MKTKFNIGQKVFRVKEDNIFECKINDISVREYKDREVETRTESYQTTFEEHIGMLECNLIKVDFNDKATNVFSTKKEALAFIEELKKARNLVVENTEINSCTGQFWSSHDSLTTSAILRAL